MWTLGWVADYPGAERLPGRPARDRQLQQLRPLVVRGASTLRSREALATRDPARGARRVTSVPWTSSATRCPSIPVAYGDGWALSRDGLLGAGQNGLQILRLAGLAWE